MTNIRTFNCDDLFLYNNINLDALTETYSVSFYLTYILNWPQYFRVVESPNGQLIGYIMGKSEGFDENWHGHVTALSIDYTYRRLNLAAKLMKELENTSESEKCYFVDLFVRVSNMVAVEMYKKLGYSVYRRILGYYSGDLDEDAFDMRKALSTDVHKKSIIPIPDPVRPEDVN